MLIRQVIKFFISGLEDMPTRALYSPSQDELVMDTFVKFSHEKIFKHQY